LDKKYPKKEEKVKIKKLDISNKDLEGSLNLENFTNLEKLDCSGNLLTSLDLTSCKVEKLAKLNVDSNNFTSQDLSFFSNFTNLEYLQITATSFSGSLKC